VLLRLPHVATERPRHVEKSTSERDTTASIEPAVVGGGARE